MATDWKSALEALASTMPDNQSESNSAQHSVHTEEAPAPGLDKARLRVDFERKGRAGKCATIISGFDGMTDSQIAEIASDLKKKLAVGGSSRGGEILIQGDRRDDVKKYFGLIK